MTISRRTLFSVVPLIAGATLVLPATPAMADSTVPIIVTRVPPSDTGYKWMIMPDIRSLESQSKTRHDNCWTIHYNWMMRCPAMTLYGETAHVNSRRYREWLEEGDYFESEREAGIPPHVNFGGAVVAGSGDPTFHQRWADYARENFA